MYTEDRDVKARTIAVWRDQVLLRAERLESRGMGYSQLIVPEKISIYPEKLDFALPETPGLGVSLLLACGERGAAVLPNLHQAFRAAASKDGLYHRTDSHWTWKGAFLAMQAMLYRLGLPLTHQDYLDLMDCPRTWVPTQGDLAWHLGLGHSISEKISFQKNARIVFENDLVRYKNEAGHENNVGLHVGCSVDFKNHRPIIDRRVLLFGDSFAEYRDGLLTFLLSEVFRNLKFVWSTNIDWELVESYSPDIVICEMTERFIWLPPVQNFNLSSFVQARMAQIRG